MSKTGKIKLDLGKENGKVIFEGVEGLSEWLQEEKKAWEWLKRLSRSNQIVGKVWQHANVQWQVVEKSLNNYKLNLNAGADTHLDSLVKSIQSVYGQNRLIRSNSPRGSFIFELAKSDPVVAAAAKAFYVGLGIAPNDSKALEGSFRALQFEQGVTSNIDAERAAMEALRTEWEAEYTALSERFAKIERESETLQAALEEAKESRILEFSQFLSDAEQSKIAIEQTYREHMALKAPVEYWTRKAGEHNRKANKLGWLAGWAGVIVALALAVATLALLVGVENPEYWRLAIVALFAALGIWLVRILTRLFLSNLHLASDAEERVTMVETFLSLMSEGHISRDEDRHLVLQTLFRSTQTGLVGDEVSPPTVIDITNKFLKDK